jgi:tetratricopeptide (TPR) repeat protein
LTTRPRDAAPSASPRYTPRDTARVPGAAGARPAPTAREGAGAPTARPRATTGARTAGTVAPVAPRLGGPRSAAPRATSITSGVTAPASSWHGHHGHHGHSSTWCGYWDPCHSWGHSYGWSSCWNWGWSCGPFSWSWSLYWPYSYYRSWYWDSCYSRAHWGYWSDPYCVSSGYWWYPSTVYCPTYLAVPSTVYVDDAPAPAASGGEVVVAGSAVAGSARAIDVPAETTLSASLAAKYVELGDFYFRANRFREAAEAYGKARSYAPNDASVHFVLADAVFADGDYHYAAFLIAEGLRLDPALATAETDKRTFYADVKTFDAQMQALDAYLTKAPYDAQAHFVRGYNLRFSAEPAKATEAFRRVLEIAPEHRAAQTFLAALAPKPAAAEAPKPGADAPK